MQTLSNVSKKVQRGFTLLELLIVIAILAILAAVVIIVLNPAQTLAQARDSQRLSDLATMKSAISLYLTTVSSPSLDAGVDNNSTTEPHCWGGTNPTSSIWYSSTVSATTDISFNTLPTAPGADVTLGTGNWAGATNYDTPAGVCATGCFAYVNRDGDGADDGTGNYLLANNTRVDGTGWLPVAFNAITGGSPLAALPLDPINSIVAATPTVADYSYRYGCIDDSTGAGPTNVFEINAVLESDKYKTTDDLDAKDGGDQAAYYEVGTSVLILPATGTAF